MTDLSKLTPRNLHIRSVAIDLAIHEQLTEHRLADEIHVAPRQARRWINKLRGESLIEHTGTTEEGKLGRAYKVWTIPNQ